MDPQGHYVIEVILSLLEVILGNEREKTRIMEEWLEADRAAMEAKEKEHSMVMRERDRALVEKEDVDKLVAEFLEADDKRDFDGQNAMMDEIVALMSRDGGDGSIAGRSGSVYGGNINYLENSQNQDEAAVMATTEGTNGDAK